MNVRALVDESVIFSLNIPENINQLLQAGVAASRTDKKTAESLFIKAYQLDPSCLQTYFALYKFYFYQARLLEAEYYVLIGLEQAANQVGFPADFQQLRRQQNQWNFYANESSLFYLYSLKALAFIKLRQNHLEVADAILQTLKEIDPEDRSGASVIMELAEGIEE